MYRQYLTDTNTHTTKSADTCRYRYFASALFIILDMLHLMPEIVLNVLFQYEAMYCLMNPVFCIFRR